MRLITSNLSEFTRVFNIVKDPTSTYFTHVFLNFKEKVLSFYNEFTVVRIDLLYTLEDGEELPKNLFVDGTKFFFLVNLHKELIIKDGVFYSNKGDKFVVPTLEEELDFIDKETYSDNTYQMMFNKNVSIDFGLMGDFIDKEGAIPAIFFLNDSTITIGSSKVIYSKLPFDKKVDFSIPGLVVRILASLKPDVSKDAIDDIIEFRLITNDDGKQTVEFNYKTLFVKYSTSEDSTLPVDPTSEEFRVNFDHKDYFVVAKENLITAIRIITSFFDSENGHCKISFISKNEIMVSAHTESQMVDYKIDLEEMTNSEEFVGEDFWISIFGLQAATNALIAKGYTKIKIQYSPNKNAIVFSDVELGYEGFYVVQTLTQSPEA